MGAESLFCGSGWKKRAICKSLSGQGRNDYVALCNQNLFPSVEGMCSISLLLWM